MATRSLFPPPAQLEPSVNPPATRGAVRPQPFALTSPSTYVLGFAIMTVVTLTERALDGADIGFALEWAILTFVALLSFNLLARVIIHATRASQAWIADYARHAAKTRADVQLLELARRDPRVMNEILAAQGRAEAVRTNVRLRAGTL